ncbi:unnamed protein product [Prorocentrum cordatum]|uniref:Uncharacterized protein n=1 Tax=Prorocentrum cordatum TaxID=2364126 RepID=A0ABN9UUX6_9DINO|nr:unnamed protein product [Polarella glacialis]
MRLVFSPCETVKPPWARQPAQIVLHRHRPRRSGPPVARGLTRVKNELALKRNTARGEREQSHMLRAHRREGRHNANWQSGAWGEEEEEEEGENEEENEEEDEEEEEAEPLYATV